MKHLQNQKIQIEEFILEAIPILTRLLSDNWVGHECQEIGCLEKMIVIDGNMKNHRKVIEL